MRINRELLVNVINEKWTTKCCPMCGANNWNIGNDMITMIGIGEDKSIQLGGRIMPLVAVTCNECGNVILVNPLAIGCTEE